MAGFLLGVGLVLGGAILVGLAWNDQVGEAWKAVAA